MVITVMSTCSPPGSSKCAPDLRSQDSCHACPKEVGGPQLIDHCTRTGAEAHPQFFAQTVLFILPFRSVLRASSGSLSVRELRTESLNAFFLCHKYPRQSHFIQNPKIHANFGKTNPVVSLGVKPWDALPLLDASISMPTIQNL